MCNVKILEEINSLFDVKFQQKLSKIRKGLFLEEKNKEATNDSQFNKSKNKQKLPNIKVKFTKKRLKGTPIRNR